MVGVTSSALSSPNESSKAGSSIVVGRADEPWEYPADNWSFHAPKYDAVSSPETFDNFRLSCTVTMRGVQFALPNYDTAFHTRYLCPAVLFYHAGIEFRSDGKEQLYRVLFSTVSKEVALYREGGGFLVVASVDVREDKPFLVEIVASGPIIKVSVDRKKAIRFVERHETTLSGSLRFLTLHSQAVFEEVRIAPLAASEPDAPAEQLDHSPNLHVRMWHRWLWLFDGAEPIARVMRYDMANHRNAPGDENGPYRYFGISDAKLVPGIEPVTPFQLDWDCSLAGVGIDKPRTLDLLEHRRESSNRVVFKWRIVDGEQRPIGDGAMTVTYDRQGDTYVYDVHSSKILTSVLKADRVQFADPWPYFAAGPATQVAHSWKRKYRYGVFVGEDGQLYKTPMNHHFWADGNIRSGGFYGYFLNQHVNPVFEMHSAELPLSVGLCSWGYDLHMQLRLPNGPVTLPVGHKLTARFRVLSFSQTRARSLMKQAKFPSQWLESVRDVVALLNTGQTLNRFGPEVWAKPTEPFDAWIWLGASRTNWDQQVGYDDNNSLRLDGPQQLRSRIGEGAFYGRMDKPIYALRGVVRTEKVAGEGFRVGMKRAFRSHTNWSKPLAGSHDWTPFEITVEGNDLVQADLFIQLNGTGTAWVDNLQFLPLAR